MKKIQHVASHVGYAILNKVGEQFLADVRKVLKGTGWHLWARGRNPDRAQFVSASGRAPYWCGGRAADFATRRRYTVGNSLPLRQATYVALYLRQATRNYPAPARVGCSSYYSVIVDKGVKLNTAKGMVDAIRKIYELHGKTVSV
jgi:hypothetical protein